MRIVISGSRGLIGRLLVARWRGCGDSVVRLVHGHGEGQWNADAEDVDAAFGHEPTPLDEADVVIHLAGAGIADRRWNEERKAVIRRSRVNGTRLVAEKIAGQRIKPAVLLCASAIGAYGNRDDEEVDEDSAYGSGYLAEMVRDWEAATAPAVAAGIRVINLRFGMVIDEQRGALAQMLAPYRWGLGGTIGGGRQWWSWIHRDDMVAAVDHLLADGTCHGPVNLVAPLPLRQRDFARCLASQLRRPAIAPLPAWAARMALGGMADAVILASTRALPTRLQDSGFSWRYPQLDQALVDLLG